MSNAACVEKGPGQQPLSFEMLNDGVNVRYVILSPASVKEECLDLQRTARRIVNSAVEAKRRWAQTTRQYTS